MRANQQIKPTFGQGQVEELEKVPVTREIDRLVRASRLRTFATEVEENTDQKEGAASLGRVAIMKKHV